MKRSGHYAAAACCVIFAIVCLDQWLKIWVKTNMPLGGQIALIGDWFHLYFVENEGMAFGISLGRNLGKLLLTLLRMALVAVMCLFLHRSLRKGRIDRLSLAVFCLVIAGALGNIIDSLFYGLAFSESTPFTVASAFPSDGGYAPFFYGKVVDMFYLKLFMLPEGFPLWGGQYFFPAIFNIADACVTTGVFMLIIFNRRIFNIVAPDAPKTPENGSGALTPDNMHNTESV